MVNSTRSRNYKNPSGKITKKPQNNKSGKNIKPTSAKKARSDQSASAPRKRASEVINIEPDSDINSVMDADSDTGSDSDVDMDRSSDLDYNEDRNANKLSDGEGAEEGRKRRDSRHTARARQGRPSPRTTRATSKGGSPSGGLARATPAKIKKSRQRCGSGRGSPVTRMAVGPELVAPIGLNNLVTEPTPDPPVILPGQAQPSTRESSQSKKQAPATNFFGDTVFDELTSIPQNDATQSFDPVEALLSTGGFGTLLDAPFTAETVTAPLVDLAEPMDSLTEEALFIPIGAFMDTGAFKESSLPVGDLPTPAEVLFALEPLSWDLDLDAVSHGLESGHPLPLTVVDPLLLEGQFVDNRFGDVCLGGPLPTPENEYVPPPEGQYVTPQVSEYVLPARVLGPKNSLAGTNELDDMTDGGKYHIDPKAFPEELPNFQPLPYTGPRARVLGTIRTKIDDTTTTIYTQYEPLPDWLDFKYTERGYLKPNVTFTAELLKKFIVNHPLGQNLIFRLEKPPSKSNHRYPGEQYQLCRATTCFSNRKIKQGHARVAIEEVWGRIPRAERQQQDPYVAAGYLHVHCFEYMIDLRAVARFGMLRDFPRETFGDEPTASKTEPNKFCLSNALHRLLKLFNRKLILDPDWNGYKTNILESLSVRMWVRGSRSATQNFKGGPPWLSPEHAERLIKERKPDPGWGGQRFHGLKSHIADELYAKGEQHRLGPVNDPDNNRQIQQMVEEREKERAQQFFDPSDWLESVFSVDASWRTEECAERKKAKKRKNPEPVQTLVDWCQTSRWMKGCHGA